jgi:hypothetical protein
MCVATFSAALLFIHPAATRIAGISRALHCGVNDSVTLPADGLGAKDYRERLDHRQLRTAVRSKSGPRCGEIQRFVHAGTDVVENLWNRTY